MRTKLKVFRVQRHMTQAQFADKIGYRRQSYAAIETGKREGQQAFWNELQKAFDVPGATMWELMQNDEE